MKDFRDLSVWHKAHELTLDVYRVTAAFPKQEMYGLTSQLRRACSSIPANLAEGAEERRCRINLLLFDSNGLSNELEYHLLLAKDLNFLKPEEHCALANRTTEIKRMLFALVKKLKADS